MITFSENFKVKFMNRIAFWVITTMLLFMHIQRLTPTGNTEEKKLMNTNINIAL